MFFIIGIIVGILAVLIFSIVWENRGPSGGYFIFMKNQNPNTCWGCQYVKNRDDCYARCSITGNLLYDKSERCNGYKEFVSFESMLLNKFKK